MLYKWQLLCSFAVDEERLSGVKDSIKTHCIVDDVVSKFFDCATANVRSTK